MNPGVDAVVLPQLWLEMAKRKGEGFFTTENTEFPVHSMVKNWPLPSCLQKG
jgi:hypothetical protein